MFGYLLGNQIFDGKAALQKIWFLILLHLS